MKIAIYGRVLHEQDIPYVKELINALVSNDFEIKFHEVFFNFIKHEIDVPKAYELFLTRKIWVMLILLFLLERMERF